MRQKKHDAQHGAMSLILAAENAITVASTAFCVSIY